MVLLFPIRDAFAMELRGVMQWHDDGGDQRLVGFNSAGTVQVTVHTEPIIGGSWICCLRGGGIFRANQPDDIGREIVIGSSRCNERHRSRHDARLIHTRLENAREPSKHVRGRNGV